MKNVLFVGEHPRGLTGNSTMMAALLEQLDTTKYRPVCFTDHTPKNRVSVFNSDPVYDVVVAQSTEQDLGAQNLIDLVKLNEDIDIVIIVGVDVWRYALAMEHIYKISQIRKFKTICILPYDLPSMRQD